MNLKQLRQFAGDDVAQDAMDDLAAANQEMGEALEKLAKAFNVTGSALHIVRQVIKIAKLNNHPHPCVAGPFGASLMLKDGTKVCINRGEGSEAAHVWLSNPAAEIVEAADLRHPA